VTLCGKVHSRDIRITLRSSQLSQEIFLLEWSDPVT